MTSEQTEVEKAANSVLRLGVSIGTILVSPLLVLNKAVAMWIVYGMTSSATEIDLPPVDLVFFIGLLALYAILTARRAKEETKDLTWGDDLGRTVGGVIAPWIAVVAVKVAIFLVS